MRVACSASLRVTPLETRACLSVSPKTLIVTIRLPSPRRTNAQGPSIPLFHRIGFTPFGQPIGQARYWQIKVAGDLLRAASLLLRFRGEAIKERGRSPVRRYIRGDEPHIVHRQPPISDRRLARCRVIFEDESPMREGPGVRAPTALTVG